MESKTKQVYYCDHCKKHGLVRSAMERHELICKKNPDNHRPCFQCVHLDKTEALSMHEADDGAISTWSVTVLCCSEKQQYLHTPVNEAKGNVYNLLNHSNNPMPKECDKFINRTEI